MKDEPLTQQVIDQGSVESASERRASLLARARQHPFLASGFMLAGAGLAYAAVKLAVQSDEVAREDHGETSKTAFERSAGTAQCSDQ